VGLVPSQQKRLKKNRVREDMGKNIRESAFYYQGPIFDVTKNLTQVIAHQRNHAQPTEEKKNSCPRG